MSSSLRVLIIGDNPNVVLYASRFQLAKSIMLYHVNNLKNSIVEIETLSYPMEKFELKNHFNSIPTMIDSIIKNENKDNSNDLFFDLIILSCHSLQELSSLSTDLNKIINKNTKIIIESSGFVQLEPFVKMSLDIQNLHVFSVLSDYDIREISTNKFQQFPNNNNNDNSTKNNIYLGSTQPSNINKLSTSSSTTSIKYPDNVITLLETFERLFKKLFPKDTIDLCNCSENNFLSKQWTFAIPRICFDSLLIILGEKNPIELQNQILAKPLISGLVTELITVTKSMGAKLPSFMVNENSLLEYWQNLYANDDIPNLVYHFINRRSSLNIDVLLLQPILLADDNGIKTPYLEFLYSVICQYDKFNKGESQWFIRSDDVTVKENEIDNLNIDIQQLRENIESLKLTIQERDNTIDQLKNIENQNKLEQDQLQKQITFMRTELNVQAKKHEIELLEAQSQEVNNGVQQLSMDMEKTPMRASNGSQVQKVQEMEYTSSGTPILNDLEEFASYGVPYGTPESNNINNELVNSQKNATAETDGPILVEDEINSNLPEDERGIKKRELELKRKELELQERELEFQKRYFQQQKHFQPSQQMPPQQMPSQQMPSQQMPSQQIPPQQIPPQQIPPQQRHTMMQMNGNQTVLQPPMSTQSRKSSYSQAQQQMSSRSTRSMYGASNSFAGSFSEVSSGSIPNSSSGNFQQNNGSQAYGQFPSHSIKPTSRKNRNSNFTNLGHASSLGLSNMNTAKNASQSRLTSMSTSSLPSQNRGRQPMMNNNNNPNSLPRMNMPNPTKQSQNTFIIGNQPLANGSTPVQLRQYSAGAVDTSIANTSMNTVVHNPMSNSVNNGSGETSFTSANTSHSNPTNGDDPSTPTLNQKFTIPNINVTTATPNINSGSDSFMNTFPPSGTPPLTENKDTESEKEKEPKEQKKKKFKLFGKKK
ncbi:hypothetical protein Kpol_193p3 [Vanderwaltozyma polyspora DSM 70294]|uniref:Ketopantoate reductase C-terminal domain-containing protein n=1 Tax=Vanderwaltozyma polyspora (strain ATCC 22028 / DSM 70294 / BCRC 21397 / CBS 2163 / NBRC 10782 / NRRL Y-8283 / UCD 57-17) TaxID=436907 RepID=A7TTM0_VANPO|nr:uncharacterized protein Kpol_193p3 [Vanderwaltozyma polyspora DSM 70294]EDO14389.1 hypothetical protein Kpol_193p3 [Vanderwaltozyma polyspora DSM 70294]